MDQTHKEYKELLKQQLQLTKEQISILDEMDNKLMKMKKIAEYAAVTNLSAKGHMNLNLKLDRLKKEIDSLEALRNNVVH